MSDFQSLYRRYRPQRFANVLGQSASEALRNSVATNRVNHAYLFSGPRGTGKTSTARILAKAINCPNVDNGEPCCKCQVCIDIAQGTSLDVHELDAASNNGVDAIRNLISTIAISTPGKNKVYILDEAHILTTAASNALLKTLEEPPPNVVFILCTTELKKILPTIRSRAQCFDFTLLDEKTLGGLLENIIEDANLDIDPWDIAPLISKAAGSARDALSVLDEAVVGYVDEINVTPLLEAIYNKDTKEINRLLKETSFSPDITITKLIEEFRLSMLQAAGVEDVGAKYAFSLPASIFALETLLKIQNKLGTSINPYSQLEIGLYSITNMVDIERRLLILEQSAS